MGGEPRADPEHTEEIIGLGWLGSGLGEECLLCFDPTLSFCLKFYSIFSSDLF